jgi:hypothetical protein
MEVDGHPPTHPPDASAVPVTQVALNPFNHSPVIERGREIVARARVESPHLVASPPVSSRTSPSRVRTFMQGRTRPTSSTFPRSTSPRTPQEPTIPPSSSTHAELVGRVAPQPLVQSLPADPTRPESPTTQRQ